MNENTGDGPVFPYKRLLLVLALAILGFLVFFLWREPEEDGTPAKIDLNSTPTRTSDPYEVPLSILQPITLQAAQSQQQRLYLQAGEELVVSVAKTAIEGRGDADPDHWQLLLAENAEPPLPISAIEDLQWTYVAGVDVREAKLCVLRLEPDNPDQLLKIVEGFQERKGPSCLTITISAANELSAPQVLPSEEAEEK